MKQTIFLVIFILFPGCSYLMPPLVIKSPEQPEYISNDNKEMAMNSTNALKEFHQTKVDSMRDTGIGVAMAKIRSAKIIAVEGMKASKDDAAKSNIAANALTTISNIREERMVKEIGEADGMDEAIGGVAKETVEASKTSAAKYGMYVGGKVAETGLAVEGAGKLFGIGKGIWAWLAPTIIALVSGGIGGGVALWKKWQTKRVEKEMEAEAHVATIEGNVEFLKKYGDKKIEGEPVTVAETFKPILSKKHAGVKKDVSSLVKKVEKKFEPEKPV